MNVSSVKEKVTVLGAGAWGSAFATLLAENGYNVSVWCYESEVAQEINLTRTNSKYLPGSIFDTKIIATNNLEEALVHSRWVFVVVPVKFLRSILEKSKRFLIPEQAWVILSKGMEQNTFLLPTDILENVFGSYERKAVISGPNFAKDLILRAHTATVVASQNQNLSLELQNILRNKWFLPYVSNDLSGVQVAGAIKNLISLSVGIVRGAEYKENTVAVIFTNGLAEICKIAEYYGGKQESIYGLAGLGDLVLTAMGSHGRNLKAGIMFGEGKTLQEVSCEFSGVLPEGINTAQATFNLIEKVGLDLPICRGTYEIIFKGRPVSDFIEEIFA